MACSACDAQRHAAPGGRPGPSARARCPTAASATRKALPDAGCRSGMANRPMQIPKPRTLPRISASPPTKLVTSRHCLGRSRRHCWARRVLTRTARNHPIDMSSAGPRASPRSAGTGIAPHDILVWRVRPQVADHAELPAPRQATASAARLQAKPCNQTSCSGQGACNRSRAVSSVASWTTRPVLSGTQGLVWSRETSHPTSGWFILGAARVSGSAQ